MPTLLFITLIKCKMKKASPVLILLLISLILTVVLFVMDDTTDTGNGDPLPVILMAGTIYLSLIFGLLSLVYYSIKFFGRLVRKAMQSF